MLKFQFGRCGSVSVVEPMSYPFCKKQIYWRYGTMISPGYSKGLRFLKTHSLIPLAVRYDVSSIARNDESFTVSYLINSCGLSPESALSVSKKVQLKNPTKPDSVLNFFKNHGFSQTQIRKIVERMPNLLLSKAEKTLLPKFQFFYSKGISSSDLSVVLSSNPSVLGYNIDNCIIPNFNFFKDFTRCDDSEVFLAYKNCSVILSNSFQSTIAPNVALLRQHGVPDSYIMTELVRHPRFFTLNHDKFRRTVEEVEKLGFNPLKSHFLAALRVLVQISKSTWERKLNVFKEFGWSDEDFVIAFEKFPECMSLSEHTIIKKMNFFVNTMNWKSTFVAHRPIVLGYSLGKRIIPRCSVLQVLLSKGFIKKPASTSFLICSEKDFLARFVTPYEDLHLLKLYKENMSLEN
ncbi:Mitochodrial transcription termination factor-related protein [Corchorus olitorius]|uniref:Mitochodrial transcription termination factor-related protein n=1 Tax=Corchorus olitorius TaxID=93759 RepID=A0A1R3IX27_9ROSI|nr:Mitochodrial transcription termination factor-related protein [Corchorus olitorius]